jgi:hypothetical protein
MLLPWVAAQLSITTHTVQYINVFLLAPASHSALNKQQQA